MPRAKYSSSYSPSFKTILTHVIESGQPFIFPEGFQSYKAAGLRTTFQAYLRTLIKEAEKEQHDYDKQELSRMAKRCIVRIKNDRVYVEDRANDAVEQELAALLRERGIKQPWEVSADAAFGAPIPAPAPVVTPDAETSGCAHCGGYGCPICETPTTPAPEPKAQTQDERVRELTKRWLDK